MTALHLILGNTEFSMSPAVTSLRGWNLTDIIPGPGGVFSTFLSVLDVDDNETPCRWRSCKAKRET
jgi:hypothetical protein